MDYPAGSPTAWLLSGSLLLGLWLWSIFWAGRDADRRGKDGALVAVLVALVGWPGSLLLWLAFRPARLDALEPKPQPLTERFQNAANRPSTSPGD